ncbi:MAG: lipase chaperone [Cellvibrionaceae bacterium]
MSRTSILISSLAAVAVVGGLAYWVLSVDETLVPIPTPNEDTQNKNSNAIANRWQWENFTGTKPAPEPAADGDNAEVEPRPTSEVPFDVVVIYNILQDIQLDDNGLVVPNQAAKSALEKAFDDLGPDVSPEAMSELQELIRIGLPGKAGEEAARVLENYYQFRLAEEEYNRQVEKQLSQMENPTPSIDRYEELMQLRRRYLGDDIADQLFAVENAQARHMFATVEIQQNADLTDEEKQAELAALQEELHDRLLGLGELTPEQAAAEQVKRLRENGASDAEIYAAREEILGPVEAQELAAADREEAEWQSRFDGFWQARQNVMQASLDEAEKERQIEQLFKQYFSPEELERARFTSYQWQTRDRE